MNYAAFKKLVFARGWTLRQLRSDDGPPTEELLAVMGRVGLKRYESFVMRLQQEADANWQRMAFGVDLR